MLRPKHRSTPVDGPTVTIDPYHVDVRRALRPPFFQDQRTFIYQGVKSALNYLLFRDRTHSAPGHPTEISGGPSDIPCLGRIIIPVVTIRSDLFLLVPAPLNGTRTPNVVDRA